MHDDLPTKLTDRNYCLTCSPDFSKTLFTPAGLDIYLREEITPQNERIVDEIVARLESLGGEVGQLAKSGFIVGR